MKIVNNIITLFDRRKELRNNSTKEEILLWQKLKNSQTGFKWRRQHSVGGYILDFYCPKQRLAIEIDGLQHLEKENKEYDEVRTKYLEGLEIKVLRFSNEQINNRMEEVLHTIKVG